MFTKYRFNQVLFLANFVVFGLFWTSLWQNSSFFILPNYNPIQHKNLAWSEIFTLVNLKTQSEFWLILKKLGFFGMLIMISGFNLHYFMNLVHLATHRLLSRNLKFNQFLGNLVAILCGLTFADFSSTHLLHHRHVYQEKKVNSKKPVLENTKNLANLSQENTRASVKIKTTNSQDPDELIAHAPHFLFLPFLIFWHDIFFWRNGLWRNGLCFGYWLNRSIQVILVLVLWTFGKLNLWLIFWLLPIYLVGFCNGIFLFYFPHYTTKWEEKRRNLNILKSNFPQTAYSEVSLFDRFWLKVIDISRYFHQLHHQNIGNSWAYFPVFSYFFSKISHSQLTKFLNFQTGQKIQTLAQQNLTSNNQNLYQFVQRKRQ